MSIVTVILFIGISHEVRHAAVSTADALAFGAPGYRVPARPCLVLGTAQGAAHIGNGAIATKLAQAVVILNISDPRIRKCESGFDSDLRVPDKNIRTMTSLPSGALLVTQSMPLGVWMFEDDHSQWQPFSHDQSKEMDETAVSPNSRMRLTIVRDNVERRYLVVFASSYMTNLKTGKRRRIRRPLRGSRLWLFQRDQINLGRGAPRTLYSDDLFGAVTSSILLKSGVYVIATNQAWIYKFRVIQDGSDERHYTINHMASLRMHASVRHLVEIPGEHILVGSTFGEVQICDASFHMLGTIAIVELYISSMQVLSTNGKLVVAIASNGVSHHDPCGVNIYTPSNSLSKPWTPLKKLTIVADTYLAALDDGRLVTVSDKASMRAGFVIGWMYDTEVWEEQQAPVKPSIFNATGDVLGVKALPGNYLAVALAGRYINIYDFSGDSRDGPQFCTSIALQGDSRAMDLLPGNALAVANSNGGVELFNLTQHLSCREMPAVASLMFDGDVGNVCGLPEGGVAIHLVRPRNADMTSTGNSSVFFFDALSVAHAGAPYATLTLHGSISDMRTASDTVFVTSMFRGGVTYGNPGLPYSDSLFFFHMADRNVSSVPYAQWHLNSLIGAMTSLQNGDLVVVSNTYNERCMVVVFRAESLYSQDAISRDHASLRCSHGDAYAVAASNRGAFFVGTSKGGIDVFRPADIVPSGSPSTTLTLNPFLTASGSDLPHPFGSIGGVQSLAWLPQEMGLAVGLANGDVLFLSPHEIESGTVKPFYRTYAGYSVVSLFQIPEIDGLYLGGQLYITDPVQDQCLGGTYSPSNGAYCHTCPKFWTSAPGSSSCFDVIWQLEAGWGLEQWSVLASHMFLFLLFSCPLYFRAQLKRLRLIGLLGIPVALLAFCCVTPLSASTWQGEFGIEVSGMSSEMITLLFLIVGSLVTNCSLLRSGFDPEVCIVLGMWFTGLVWNHSAMVVAAYQVEIPFVRTMFGYSAAMTGWHQFSAYVNMLAVSLILVGCGAVHSNVKYRLKPLTSMQLGYGQLAVKVYSMPKTWWQCLCKYRLSWRGKHYVGLANGISTIVSLWFQIENVSRLTLTRSRGQTVIRVAIIDCIIHAWSLLVDHNPMRFPHVVDDHFRLSTLLKSIIVISKLNFMDIRAMEQTRVNVFLPLQANASTPSSVDICMDWSCYGTPASPGGCPLWCVHGLSGICLHSDGEGCLCHYYAKLPEWKVNLTMANSVLTTIVMIAFSWGNVFMKTISGKITRLRIASCLLVTFFVPHTASMIMQITLKRQGVSDFRCFDEKTIRRFGYSLVIPMLMVNEISKILKGISKERHREALESADGLIVLRCLTVPVATVAITHFWGIRSKCPRLCIAMIVLFALLIIAVVALPNLGDRNLAQQSESSQSSSSEVQMQRADTHHGLTRVFPEVSQSMTLSALELIWMDEQSQLDRKSQEDGEQERATW